MMKKIKRIKKKIGKKVEVILLFFFFLNRIQNKQNKHGQNKAKKNFIFYF